MKFSGFSKLIGAGVIAASLAIVPLTYSVQAQDNAPGTTGEAPEEPNPLPDQTERGDTNDAGWFGLLGLAGLAGLAARNRRETVHTHTTADPNVRVGSDSNYR